MGMISLYLFQGDPAVAAAEVIVKLELMTAAAPAVVVAVVF